MKWTQRKGVARFLKVLIPALLLLIPLRHIRFGVEWWDTGYNYANFTYMDNMDPMWLFSTFLGTALGNVFTKLPLGNTMLGLNLYTGLMVSVTALLGYYFMVKVVKVPKVFAFVGELVAIGLCWCPTALLYNYLTYFLFDIGVVFLYLALREEDKYSKYYFVAAGVMLGMNVFTRFSNLAQMGLIAGVWAMSIIRKEKIGKLLANTGFCVLGYVLGAGVVFVGIAIKYGPSAYIRGVIRLLNMPSSATDYTVTSMVLSQIQNYIQNCIWLAWLLLFCFLGTVVYTLLPKWNWLNLVKKIGYVVCAFLGFYYLRNKDMFNFMYTTIQSVFQWAVFLLTATLIIGVVAIFSKKFSEQEKLLCGLNMLLILITPLGSNNHLYAAINNLFLVAPVTLWFCYRFLKWLPKEIVWKKLKVSTFTIKAMMISMAAALAIQGVLFAHTFVFIETRGGENMNTKVTENQVLKGMLTTAERAELLNEITTFVKEENLTGREVVLYGQLPALSYYLQMPFAISAWADLPSYQYSVMEEDLSRVYEEAVLGEREFPVILLEKKQGGILESDEEIRDPKLNLLQKIIEEYNYQLSFENDKFLLFEQNGENND